MTGNKFDCVGLGICAADYLCLLPEYPALDEKTELLAFSKQGGGPVPTALVTLARLGARVSYIGKVGDDTEGQFLIQQFQQEGVDLSALIVDKNVRTPQAFIWVDRATGKKVIALNRTNMIDVQPEELSRHQVIAGQFLHLDGREVAASIQAAQWAKEAGCQVVLDVGSLRPQMERLLSLADYPIVSENFVRQFWGSLEPSAAARRLLNYGSKAAVVTCGRNGSFAASAQYDFYQPAFEVVTVDTTGAGDVYHGAFIFGLLQKWDLPRILKFASAVAAIKCTQLGGRAGIPSLKQVQEFLAAKQQ
ncbi:MAG: PfkB family carbohydrate kinase [candidate division KSB1 bacterium]|nr:PfkB family carbohydrate kinase [candidate division KSB1 bacterium]